MHRTTPERNGTVVRGRVIDRRLAERLPGREKIRALLTARNRSLASWARSRGFWPEQVTMTLAGARRYPEIREALAQDLEVPREEIDELIDGKPPESPAQDAPDVLKSAVHGETVTPAAVGS